MTSATGFAVTPNVNAASDGDRAAVLSAPGFGKYFTDHMVRIDWTAGSGWGHGQVLPYGPIALDPACAVTAARSIRRRMM